MERFSLYDLLSVLFPGVIFLYMLDWIRTLFDFFSKFTLSGQWEMIIVLSVLSGALIYALSFKLVSFCKCIYRFFRLYKDLTTLYYSLDKHVLDIVESSLNQRANEWYKQDLYPPKADFENLSAQEQEAIRSLQEDFYDRMYYELDYEGRLDSAKSVQSFYLFFRNLFVASAVCSLLLLILQLVFLIPIFEIKAFDCMKTITLFGFIILNALSVMSARWYRQRMVSKMYWYFYSHINNTKK